MHRWVTADTTMSIVMGSTRKDISFSYSQNKVNQLSLSICQALIKAKYEILRKDSFKEEENCAISGARAEVGKNNTYEIILQFHFYLSLFVKNRLFNGNTNNLLVPFSIHYLHIFRHKFLIYTTLFSHHFSLYYSNVYFIEQCVVTPPINSFQITCSNIEFEGAMFQNMKKILYLLLIVTCTIHISSIGYAIFFPNLPEIRVYKKDLKDIEFPISFRICAYELTNKNERFKKMGYKSASNYFRGRSMFNESLVGWGGQTENGSNIGTIQGKCNKKLFQN